MTNGRIACALMLDLHGVIVFPWPIPTSECRLRLTHGQSQSSFVRCRSMSLHFRSVPCSYITSCTDSYFGHASDLCAFRDMALDVQ
jgi:hypothetical protein